VSAPTPNELLRKILELEAKKQYDDSAVIGGLDACVATVGPSLPPALKPALARLRTPGGYRGWAVAQRAEWVTTVLALLQDSAAKPARRPTRPSSPGDSPSAAASTHPESQPVTVLTRVSTRTAALLAHLRVTTVGDLLCLLPRRYLDYTHTRAVADLEPDIEQTVVGRVLKATWVYPGGRRSTEAVFGDKTGTVKLLWFNQPWMARALPVDRDIVISGMVTAFGRRLQIQSPEGEGIATSGIHNGGLVSSLQPTQGTEWRSTSK